MYYQPNYYQPVTTPQLYPSSSVSSQQQQQTVQNDGELIRVNGISGAYQCQLPANSNLQQTQQIVGQILGNAGRFVAWAPSGSADATKVVTTAG